MTRHACRSRFGGLILLVAACDTTTTGSADTEAGADADATVGDPDPATTSPIPATSTSGDGTDAGPPSDDGGASGDETGAPPLPPVCGNDIAEAGEACDGRDIPGWEDDVDCGLVLGGWFHGPVSCSDDCTIDTSQCTSCGDGIVQPDFEACEPGLAPAATCADLLGADWDGELACQRDCNFDDSGCERRCGNATLDPGEACDGEDFGGATCASEGFVGGDLHCNSACQVSTGGCNRCGDGVLDPGEDCDANAFGALSCASFLPGGTGSLSCDDACEVSANACVASDATIVISEVMAISLAAPLTSAGEWLELHNPSPTEAFDLLDCEVQGQALFETFAFDDSLVVTPGGFVTLGKGAPDELGFTPDFELPAQTSFLNDGDLIRISCAGVVLDEVTYGGAGWPALEPGVSIAVAPSSLNPLDNDAGPSWCASTEAYAPMLFGSPGAANACAPSSPSR